MKQRTKSPEWLVRKVMDGQPYALTEPRSIEERINIYEMVLADMERKIVACREVIAALRPAVEEEKANLAKRNEKEVAKSPRETQDEHIQSWREGR